MARNMKLLTVFCIIAAVLCGFLYYDTRHALPITLAITFGTTACHLCMRLAVGAMVNALFHNHMDVTKRWFQVGPREQRLYEWLKVKRWKHRLPTYDKDAFDPRKHTWHEIAQAMCQSEVVHSLNVVLSFLPIVAARWFGALPAFIITSLLAAGFDLLFVILQRYNRPRVLKLLKK